MARRRSTGALLGFAGSVGAGYMYGQRMKEIRARNKPKTPASEDEKLALADAANRDALEAGDNAPTSLPSDVNTDFEEYANGGVIQSNLPGRSHGNRNYGKKG